jgi:DNA topoisomerase I
MKKLVIVESPSKSRTIEGYLGNEYIVKSSKGHVRDLASKGKGGLGVDVDHDFAPTYVVIDDKKAIVKELVEASKTVDEIFLATDPDREGEAISWHLSELLDTANKPVHRVIFNEITKSAILGAFQHPGHLDLPLVSSQEARRIVDRIIGFKLSKLLQRKIKSKSAGRVQSAALRLIVEREAEIRAFVIEEYYEIHAIFETFEAELARYNGKTPKIETRAEAQSIIENLKHTFVVESVQTKLKSVDSKPPFITSTLQQEASTRLNMPSKKTMQIAQKLYEGIKLGDETVGLISYMRTDSIRLSADFIHRASDYVTQTYGKSYLGHAKKGADAKNVQDAHEAIRPTDPFRTPESVKPYLTKDELALYTMIHARAVASLMKAATTHQTTVWFENGDARFKSIENKPEFDGYLRAYGKYESEEGRQEVLPLLKEGDRFIARSVLEKQCFTTPPPRYNEARLIKELEDKGIGRPSTYATIVSILKDRKYVDLVEKKFVPTEQGQKTIEALNQYFDNFISADYTKRMEDRLDAIAEGTEDRLVALKEFYDAFEPTYEIAMKNMEVEPAKETGETCPSCGKPLVHRKGRYGEFEACSGYPACKYIKRQEPKEGAAPKRDTNVVCPECKKHTLVLRTASKGKNKGNQFLACSGYPKCKYISPLVPIQRDCPKCGNLLVEDADKHIVCVDQTNCRYHEHH